MSLETFEKKKYFNDFFFQIDKILKISKSKIHATMQIEHGLIAMFNLHVVLKTNRFYLQSCTRDDDSPFLTEIGRT